MAQVNREIENESPVCWGAEQIAEEIGLSERQAFHRLQKGQIVHRMPDGKFAFGHGSKCTQIGGSPPDWIARVLAKEL